MGKPVVVVVVDRTYRILLATAQTLLLQVASRRQDVVGALGTTGKVADALFDRIRMTAEETVDLRRHPRNVLPLVQLGSAL